MSNSAFLEIRADMELSKEILRIHHRNISPQRIKLLIPNPYTSIRLVSKEGKGPGRRLLMSYDIIEDWRSIDPASSLTVAMQLVPFWYGFSGPIVLHYKCKYQTVDDDIQELDSQHDLEVKLRHSDELSHSHEGRNQMRRWNLFENVKVV